MPTWADIKASTGPAVRGTAIGAFFGLLPGASPTISAFSSYAVEKKMARDKSIFGKGAIQGLAGPEAANNATVQCAFIPTLTLGLPVSGTMALMLGALMIQGISPGPQVMTQNPDLFWGLVVSMWIGNGLLLILNLPLVSLWVKLLRVPYRFLFPAIMVFMAIGVYSVQMALDIYLTVFFGVMGYVFMQFKIEPAVGPGLRSRTADGGAPQAGAAHFTGDPMTFLTRPISAAFLIMTGVLLLLMILPAIKKKPAKPSDDRPSQGEER